MIAILIAYIADKSQKQGSGGQGSWKQKGQGAAPTPYILGVKYCHTPFQSPSHIPGLY